jgi:hypothetical protein
MSKAVEVFKKLGSNDRDRGHLGGADGKTFINICVTRLAPNTANLDPLVRGFRPFG